MKVCIKDVTISLVVATEKNICSRKITFTDAAEMQKIVIFLRIRFYNNLSLKWHNWIGHSFVSFFVIFKQKICSHRQDSNSSKQSRWQVL